MGKKKSIALLTIISVVLAVLMAMTFLNFHVPFVKQGVYKYTSLLKYVDLDVDLEGGYSYTIQHKAEDDEFVNTDDVVKTLESRLEALNYSNYKITLLSSDSDSDAKIRLDVEATESVVNDINAVIAYGEVVFSGGESGSEVEIAKGSAVLEDAYYYGTSYEQDGKTVYPIVLELTDYGYETILQKIKDFETEQASAESPADFNLKAMLGETELLNTPTKSSDFEAMKGQMMLTGPESEADAERFAFQMTTGGLKYQYEIIGAEESTGGLRIVTPLLGIKADVFVKIAVGVIVLAVIACLCILFKGLGLSMSIAFLAQFLLQILMLYLVPGIKVSMGSVLGFVFALMLSAIACITFAYRMKKEYASGKTMRASVRYAYGKPALVSLDTHVACGVIALALFIFANGVVKGFAITFGIGVALSGLVSILFSRLMTLIFIGVSGGSEKFLALKKED